MNTTVISTDMPDLDGSHLSLWLAAEKSFYQSYLEWMFLPNGYRKVEPRSKFSHFLNRIEGIARRKETKRPRKLKKKLNKKINHHE